MLKLKHYSDQQLIDLILSNPKNEGKAIQYLLDQNRKKIVSYVLKNSGNKADADTVLVEGVTHLVFNVRKGKFRGESKLSTYLFAICRGVWFKELRKRKHFVEIDAADQSQKELISSFTPLDYFSESELKEQLSILLGQLGSACKMVLELWAGHFSMTEIAKQLGYKNAQIAMNKKNRCMGKLRELLSVDQVMSESLKSYLGYD